MAQICSEAQMGPGHVYHYFDGKEAIIEAIIEEDLRRGLSIMEGLERDPSAFPTLMGEVLAEQVRSGFPGLGREIRAEVLAEASRNPRVAKLAGRQEESFLRILKDRLREGQKAGVIDPDLDVEVGARLLIAVARGVALSKTDPATTEALARGVQLLVARLLLWRSDSDRAE